MSWEVGEKSVYFIQRRKGSGSNTLLGQSRWGDPPHPDLQGLTALVVNKGGIKPYCHIYMIDIF